MNPLYNFDDVLPTATAATVWKEAPYCIPASEWRLKGDQLVAAADALVAQYVQLLSAYDRLHQQWSAATDRLDNANLELRMLAAYLHDIEVLPA